MFLTYEYILSRWECYSRYLFIHLRAAKMNVRTSLESAKWKKSRCNSVFNSPEPKAHR